MPRVVGEPVNVGATPGIREGRLRSGSIREGRVVTGAPAESDSERRLREFSEARAASDSGGGPFSQSLTTLNAALNYASQPVYAVGNVVTGRPGQAGLNALNFVLPGTQASDRLSGRRTLPSEALPQGGGVLGAIGRFGADVALDPLTYLTFGGASAARTAGSAASRELLERTSREGVEGITVREMALQAGRTAAEREAVEKAISVGLRIPGSRNKSLTLAESKRAARLARRALDRVGSVGGGSVGRGGDLLVRNFASTRGAGAVEREAAQAARRASEGLANQYATQAARLDRMIGKAARTIGMDRGAASTAIARHLDNPAKYDVPVGLEAARDEARTILARIGDTEVEAGIERGSVANYVPHLLAKPRDRANFSRQHGVTGAALDNPFFTKERIAPNLDVFEQMATEAGAKVETNIARLIEKRGRASARALQSKGTKDAVAELKGVREPLPPRPDVEGARESLGAAEAQLAAVSAGDDPAARRLAVAERGLVRATARLRRAEANGSRRLVKAERKRVVAAEVRVRDLRARAAADPVGQPYVGTPRQIGDATRRLDVQEREVARAERQADEFDEVVRKLASQPGRRATPEEWAVVSREWKTVEGKYLEDVKFSPEDAESLERALRAIDSSTRDPDSFDGLVRFANSLTNRWKALALMTPGYHVRNQLGDGIGAYWAGARNPATYALAARVVAGKGLDRKVNWKGLGGSYTLGDVKALSTRIGNTGSGQVPAEIGSSADKVRRGGPLRPSLPGSGRIAAGSRAVGQAREDVMRMFLFMERLKAGDNALEAARVTREYLFDYGDVSRFVEQARRFFLPFVTYQAKAIPMVAKTFVTRPGIPANLNTAIEHSNRASGIEDRSLLRGSTFGIPAPKALNALLGIGRDENITIDPKSFLPFGSLDLIDPRRGAIERNLGGLASTFVTTPLQIATMRNFYFNQSLEQADGSTRKVALPPFLRWAEGTPVGSALGIGPKSNYVYRDGSIRQEPGLGYSSLVDLALRMYPIYGRAGQLQPGDPERRRLGVAKVAFGFPFGTENQARSAAYAKKFDR